VIKSDLLISLIPLVLIGRDTMTGFIERIHLKEKAEEDLYFAKQDKKLIQALHDKKAGKESPEKVQIRDVRSDDKH
jgi:hypothetical protein